MSPVVAGIVIVLVLVAVTVVPIAIQLWREQKKRGGWIRNHKDDE